MAPKCRRNCHSAKEIEMQTMQDEQSGLPDTSYEETPLLGSFSHKDDKPAILESKKEIMKNKFPTVDFREMDPIGFSKEGDGTEIVAFGRRGGETKIFKSDGKTLVKSFIEKYSKALGPSAEEIIAERRKSKRNEKRRLKANEKKLKQEQKVTAQNEKAYQKQQASRLRLLWARL